MQVLRVAVRQELHLNRAPGRFGGDRSVGGPRGLADTALKQNDKRRYAIDTHGGGRPGTMVFMFNSLPEGARP
jgi:hypothetical protein